MHARLLLVIFLTLSFIQSHTVSAADILARVNGEPITDQDLELEILSRSQDPQILPEPLKRKVLEDLIDRELLSSYLQAKRVKFDRLQVEQQLKLLKQTISTAEKDPDETLEELGFTGVKLAERLRLASRWQSYFDQNVGEQEIERYFKNYKQHFDGTELRASQILIKLPSDASPTEIAAAKAKLQSYKEQIEAGKLSFAEAAKKWSESPSAQAGGDLGFSPYYGKRLSLYSEKLFPLEVEGMTEPFQSPFGMHLMQVTEKRPGTFELVDVYDIVVDRLKKEFFNLTVSNLRSTATIEYTSPTP